MHGDVAGSVGDRRPYADQWQLTGSEQSRCGVRNRHGRGSPLSLNKLWPIWGDHIE
jgi:hypothetical protein